MKDSIKEFLDSKLKIYGSSDKELIKFRDYIKEFKTTAANLKRSERVEEVAYMFSSGKELTEMLNNLKLDFKPFNLADLNLVRYDRLAFE
jgi:hypothetical protein